MDISRMAEKLDQLGFIVNPISPAAECGLSDRLLLEMPEKKFYKVCKLCQYRKMITLDEEVCHRAERALRRMFELTGQEIPGLQLLRERASFCGDTD